MSHPNDRASNDAEIAATTVHPEAEDSGQPRPRRNRRVPILAGVGLSLCGIVGTGSWWLQANYQNSGAPYTPPAPLSEVAVRYGQAGDVTVMHLTPEIEEALALEIDDAELWAEFEATEMRLREEDSHLDAALDDPEGTPLLGAGPLVSQADISAQFEPQLDRLVDDYLRATTDDPGSVRKIAGVMRRLLRGFLYRQSASADDLAVLREARASGNADPLALLCLYRCGPSEDEDPLAILTEVQEARQRRQVGAEAGVMISACLLECDPNLDAETRGQLTEQFIQDVVDVWQGLDQKQHFAAQDYWLDYTLWGFNQLSANGKIDLLLELQRRQNPEIERWLVHYIANRVLFDAAMYYRGTSYISKMKSEDRDRFGELSARSSRHLLKAWTLAPKHWRLSHALFDLELRSGSTPRTTEQWFRHALAARVDRHEVFSLHEGSLETKWGGSEEAQIRFAEQCVDAGDLDSGLPFYFTGGLRTYFNDSLCTATMADDMRIRHVTQRFVDLLKEYSADKAHHRVNATSAALVVPVLWQAGRFEDLAWFMTVYDKSIEDKYLQLSGIRKEHVAAITRGCLGSNPSCWRTLHQQLFGDARQLTLPDLDQVELAIAEAEAGLETADGEADEVAVRTLAACRRSAAGQRALLLGEEWVLTDEDLQAWMVRGAAKAIVFPRDPYDGAKPDQPSYGLEAIPADVGVVEFRPILEDRSCLLSFPQRIEPPLSLSADIEKLDPHMDPYGVSLLVGPTGSSSNAFGFVGPIATVTGRPMAVLRDQLPWVSWDDPSTFKWRRFPASNIDYTQEREVVSIKVEAFPDGYKIFTNGTLADRVVTPLQTAGVLQIGRYSNVIFKTSLNQPVRYRVSNVRIQKLSSPSVEISGPL